VNRSFWFFFQKEALAVGLSLRAAAPPTPRAVLFWKKEPKNFHSRARRDHPSDTP
jgi:hypothetical protein